MSKKKDKIDIQFIGMSAQEVTGSCIWIKTPNRQLLLELGLYQTCGNNSVLTQYKINSSHFKFNPEELDYIFVCHTHQDHLGNVPRAYKKGAQCPLIMPKGSRSIAEILLLDSAKIMASDAQDLSNKFQREYYPIYDENDVATTLNHLVEYPINEMIVLDEYIKFRFIPAGHILNSAQLELYITNGNLTKKILYTSDLGNVHIEKHYVDKFEPCNKADIVIGESTYGRERHIASQKTREADMLKLKTVIEQTCIENKSRVMIPVFANSRCQELLTSLYLLFGEDPNFRIPVLVDSPMSIRICNAYRELLSGDDLKLWEKVLTWKNIVFVTDAMESKAWRDDTRPSVVLCSSGMVTQGRSVLWARKILPRVNDRVVFCGYSAEGSIGAIIKEGKQKTITIGGTRVKNKCQVTNLTSFSSHMQFDSLVEYYGSIDCEKIILVHGDEMSKMSIVSSIEEEISKNDRTSKVIISNKGYSLKI